MKASTGATVVAVVAALALGVGAGWWWGAGQDESPVAFTRAAPVPARSPSYPAGLTEVLPDPATAPLRTGLSHHEVKLGPQDFGVTVSIPNGWVSTHPNEVEWHFYPPPGLVDNTYFLRVKLIGSLNLTVAQAIDQRLDALQAVVFDFDVLSQTNDTFAVSYVSNGYRRIAYERFLALDGTDRAYLTVAAIGRSVDADALPDLLDSATRNARLQSDDRPGG